MKKTARDPAQIQSRFPIGMLLFLLYICGSPVLAPAAEPVLDFWKQAQAGPQREPLSLKKVRLLTGAEMGTAEGVGGSKAPHGSFPGHENSGIVRSRQFADLFWLHNDSGDEPRVYPIRANGEDYQAARAAERMGVLLGGAINIDWEDITVDSAGNLILADVGNNRNDRRDLMFYLIPEPAPSAARATYLTRYFVRYPDQPSYPAPESQKNFDCEAVFTIGETIYLLSKNRSDTQSTLYRLDDPKSDQINLLTKLQTLNLGAQVTGADASVDGKRLAILTYKAIWLFEREKLEAPFFTGRVRWAPYELEQAEAICFQDDQTLKITDEASGMLYDVKIEQLYGLSP